MAKKVTKKKKAKTAVAKEKTEASSVPPSPVGDVSAVGAPTTPVAAPYTPPGPQKFELYIPVENVALSEHARGLSLDQVRMGLQQKVEVLKGAGHACPDALYTDIENVIIWLQTAAIGDVIANYVRIMETLRYWRTYCKDQERVTERKRKMYQRQLKINLQAHAQLDGGKKLTVDGLDSAVRIDPVHDEWQGYQDDWMFLGEQIHNIILSMQTEMLVQNSMWERRGDLDNNGTPNQAISQ